MVNCYTQFLKSRTAVEAEPNGKEYLHIISAAAQRMDALLTGVLSYACLLGSQAPEHGPVDMNAVLQTALANLQMQIDQTGATIAHDQLPKVLGDFSQLSQLMQNLVSNAIKYRATAPPEVIVKAVKSGATEWLFLVQDNGVGIDPKHYERLFLPFRRLHGHEIPGVGLGLAICRSIVERHHGRIWVMESAEGQGARFAFTLPHYETA